MAKQTQIENERDGLIGLGVGFFISGVLISVYLGDWIQYNMGIPYWVAAFVFGFFGGSCLLAGIDRWLKIKNNPFNKLSEPDARRESND